MKVKELREKLNSQSEGDANFDEQEARILVKDDGKRIRGSSPSVGIRGFMSGFDWNSGRLLISTELELMEYKKESNYSKRQVVELFEDYSHYRNDGAEDEPLEFGEWLERKIERNI